MESKLYRKGDRIMISERSHDPEKPPKKYLATVVKGPHTSGAYSGYIKLDYDKWDKDAPPIAIPPRSYDIEFLDEDLKRETGPEFQKTLEEELRVIQEMEIPDDMAIRRTVLQSLRNLADYIKQKNK
jgi:hypothetical protein